MFNPFKTRKICKYCECGYPMNSQRANGTDMRILYGHNLHVSQCGIQDLDFNIKYCPMCGRRINHQTKAGVGDE